MPVVRGPAYKCLRRILPPADRKAKGNLKARLRMLVIYYFANKFNYLVAGTGNKSELLMGYFTKYGDGAVDFLPLGGLLKREVRLLAEAAGIPSRIINKPPTAGLWQGQTDESEMGISYKELDDILFNLERGRKPKTSVRNLSKVKALIKTSEHKRLPAAMFKP
jgi:NAD+ synthase